MKHLAKIQAEFVKEARDWDDMSYEEQKEYLGEHRKSKRKLTAKPEQELDTKSVKEKLEDKKESLNNNKLDFMSKDVIRDLSYDRVFDFEESDEGVSWTAHNDKYPDEPTYYYLDNNGSLHLEGGDSTSRTLKNPVKTKEDLKNALSDMWDDDLWEDD